MNEPTTWEPWHLPSLNDGNKVVPSAEKERKDRQQQAEEDTANTTDNACDAEDLEESVEEESVEVIEQAQVQLPSAEELEQIRKSVELEAYREGFEKGEAHGRESGYQQAYQETKQDIESHLGKLEAISEALKKPLDDQDQTIEKILLDSVVTIAKAVVGRELTNQPEQILGVVKQAVAALPYGETATKIYVNPSDLSFIESHAKQHPHWQLLADEQITAGGCKVVTADSSVDATVEARLQAVVDQFLNKQLASGDAGQANGE